MDSDVVEGIANIGSAGDTRESPGSAKARPWEVMGRAVEHLRPRNRADSVYVLAVLVIAIHVASAGLEGQGFGVVGIPPVLAAILVLLVVAWVAFLAGGRAVRVALATVIGLFALFFGVAVSLAQLATTGPSVSAVTGALAAIAGSVLIGEGFQIGLRGHRRLVKAILIPVLALLVFQWVVSPAIWAGMATNAPRPSVPSAASLGIAGAADVTFPARDGVPLAGWYVPGGNGSAVILMHGSHTSRLEVVAHLRMLVQAGFAVLAYDARGHGTSGGLTDTKGWTADLDVAGAFEFLGRQPGVDPNRIGALGLSIGAMNGLRAAADGIPLRAVVADGAGASTYGDIAAVDSQDLMWPLALSGDWLGVRATEFLSGVPEPSSLRSIVGSIRVPVMLIASTEPSELAHDTAYRDAIGANATLWYIPDVGHVQGLAAHPAEYTARVTAFLSATLAPAAGVL